MAQLILQTHNQQQDTSLAEAPCQHCRTIADGTCTFPNNLFGCGNKNVAGHVKFIADDLDLECQVSLPAYAVLQQQLSTSCSNLLYGLLASTCKHLNVMM